MLEANPNPDFYFFGQENSTLIMQGKVREL